MISTIPGSPRDLELVVVVRAFHDFDKPAEWLVNLKKYLRAGANVAIIDRDPEKGCGIALLAMRPRAT